MFDGIWQAGVAFFIFFNWWSFVAIAIVIAFAFLGWRLLAVPPKSSIERIAYDQNKDNIRESRTPFRRFVITCFVVIFSLMGSTLFCIAVFNILSQ